jgi:16S rRNA (uracil1498-N3)-methyltransferase
MTGQEVRIINLTAVAQPMPRTIMLSLAAALIKPARFEWMLEKGTELGVAEFIPLETRFSDTCLNETNITARLERWRRIVRQACEQCGRAVVPTIRSPMPLSNWLTMQEFSHGTRLMCSEKGGTLWTDLDFPAGPFALCIGPEGGWDPVEIEHAQQAGCILLSFGNHILRAETAALAAVALIRFGIRLFPIHASARLQQY